MALFLFFGKGGSGVVANCSLFGDEATLSFSQGPVCSIFFRCSLRFSASSALVSVAPTSLPVIFFPKDFRFVFNSLYSPPFFLLPQSLWQIWQELSSLSFTIRLQWVSGHSFPPKNEVADELGRRGVLLLPPSVPSSYLLFPIVFAVVSRAGGVLSYLNSSTHRYSWWPLRNLCSLVTLAVFSLVFAATNTAFSFLHSYSLGLAESRIFHAAPSVVQSWPPPISFCTVHPRNL